LIAESLYTAKDGMGRKGWKGWKRWMRRGSEMGGGVCVERRKSVNNNNRAKREREKE
jgi:hypothetical protein